jgi:hypothetical protein
MKNFQPTNTSQSDWNQCQNLCKKDPTCFAFYQHPLQLDPYSMVCNLYSEPADKNILFNSAVKAQSLLEQVAFRKCEIPF